MAPAQVDGDALTTVVMPSSVEPQLEELSEAECRVLIGLTSVGRIGFVVDGRPFVLPVNYESLSDVSGLWIFLLTRPGNIIDGAWKHVAFEIDGIDLGRKRGWSVLVRGILHDIDHNVLPKGIDPMSWVPQGRTSWLAIESEIVTGRRIGTAEGEWARWRPTLSTTT